MLNFIKTTHSVEIEYQTEYGNGNDWIWKNLNSNGSAEVSRTFIFEKSDLLNPPQPTQDFETYEYRFCLGRLASGYLRIPGRILDSQNDLWIDENIKLKRSKFTAERNVSIFGRLSKILDHSNPIVIGGKHPDAIPEDAFDELLKKFPNTYELNRYAEARVHTILSQYIDGMKDARGRYERYLNRKQSLNSTTKVDLDQLKKLEIEKYILIRDLIEDALTNHTNFSEKEWQQLMLNFLLLLFPKYIKVFENVTIHDYYTDHSKKTNRFLDIALIDANGNLDIIEIKKPFEDKILRKGLYRGNSIPTSELSGSVMQAEKYLFHLSKWGIKGEETLSKKYAADLPIGMSVKISNPKATIIVGRDQIGGGNMSSQQLLDFEIIKRKYANMVDIITYDDLLRRLDNTIAALSK
ncbi:Shedu immune nuclease family protein [Parasphingorhabdus sp.]|uniref:Shedu immune nuclease family protein n=1 Tax=Parasphingorhabdus sp. TaxID=2709688 RepID=UPI003A9109AE